MEQRRPRWRRREVDHEACDDDGLVAHRPRSFNGREKLYECVGDELGSCVARAWVRGDLDERAGEKLGSPIARDQRGGVARGVKG